jgi:hypothetical protein
VMSSRQVLKMFRAGRSRVTMCKCTPPYNFAAAAFHATRAAEDLKESYVIQLTGRRRTGLWVSRGKMSCKPSLKRTTSRMYVSRSDGNNDCATDAHGRPA